MVSYDGLHEKDHSRQWYIHTHTCGSIEACSWGGLLDHSSVNKIRLSKTCKGWSSDSEGMVKL